MFWRISRRRVCVVPERRGGGTCEKGLYKGSSDASFGRVNVGSKCCWSFEVCWRPGGVFEKAA